MCTQRGPLLLCCWEWRGAFSLSFGATSCACVILHSVCSNKARTHTLTATYAHPVIHTHIFYAYVIQQTPHRHYWNGLRTCSTDRPTHNYTLSMCDSTPMLSLDCAMCFQCLSPSKSPPCSCDWFVLSVSMSAHILTRPRACTVSGINVCVRSDTVWQPVFYCCVMLKLNALFHAACTALRVQHAIYRPASQGQKRLLFGKNNYTFSLSYLGWS